MTPIELWARRGALGLSQAELAGLLGVKQTAISQWESGKRAPRDPEAIRAQFEELAEMMLDLLDQIEDRIEGASAKLDQHLVTVRTYRTDAAYWADDAGAKAAQIPAAVHRTAVAYAAMMCESEFGVTVQIVEAAADPEQ